MTQEEKLQLAKEWYNDPSTTKEIKSHLEELFPELKESEDERIRKWCVSHFRECFRVTKDNVEYQEYLNNKVIPWLEKQGEQEPEIKYIYPKFRVGDVIEPVKPNGHYVPVRVKYIGEGDYSCESDDCKSFLSFPICNENEYVLTEQNLVEPVTVVERDGEKWVRVCALGEDFIIAAHDYKDGDKTEFTWKEACKIGTFNKKQGYIMLALKDEINARLEEIGGEPLASYYWSSSEYNQNSAWYVDFNSGYVNYSAKYDSLIARAVAAF